MIKIICFLLLEICIGWENDANIIKTQNPSLDRETLSFKSDSSINKRVNEKIKKESKCFSTMRFKDFHIIEELQKSDTLCIVSTHPFVFYPFGEFNNIESFMNRLPEWKLENKLIIDKGFEIYELSYQEDRLILLYDDDFYKKQLDIVKADLYSENIFLENNIHIGINKWELIECFTNINSLLDMSQISVVEIISGLDGVWQYYIFEDDILTSIVMKTNFHIQYEGKYLEF